MKYLLVVVTLILFGCGNDLKKDEPPLCGNGRLDSSEICDWGINDGPGACPTQCEATGNDQCSNVVLVGDRLSCSAECIQNDAACGMGDGCCPSGCDSTRDADCSNTCGNGVVEGGETCDGDCPTTCDDRDACTINSFSGSADTCSLVCAAAAITQCVGGDGCCGAGCTPTADSDCSQTCGDGIVDAGELCDGNCPTNCDDGLACTQDRLVGSAASCNSQCLADPITTCVGGDSCCPEGCSSANDTDCACVPTTCDQVGWTCGELDTGCNTTENCGMCTTSQVCDGGSCVDVADRGIGSACTSDAQCDSGTCLTEAGYGYPAGYCVGTCDIFFFSCEGAPANGVCDGISCKLGCSSNADCRTGYECYTRLGTNTQSCQPVGLGARAIGQSCSSSMDCAGGKNAFCAGPFEGYKNGYCQQFCDATNLCPSGSHCSFDESGVGICLRDCASNASCRGNGMDGYMCYDPDGDGTQECFVAGTGVGAVGAPCDGGWDCGGGAWGRCGLEHNGGFPEGYCSIGCGTNQGACPSGSHCGGTVTSNFCVANCSSSAQCRPEYTCQEDGAVDACWPPP